MKFNKPYFFITASSVALLIVLLIQVNWIFDSAKNKEELFHEKSEIVLSKTIDALRNDSTTYRKIQTKIGEAEKRKIDSLLHHFMQQYDVQLAYTFNVQEVNKNTNNSFFNFNKNTCRACINDANDKTKLNLEVIFPDKKTYILAELKIPFFVSVLLMIIVLLISWRTIFSVLKEKKIAEQTNDFLNNMTHEFKTPITNISLATSMLTNDSAISKNEKLKNYASIILSENEKLKQQAEQILSFRELEIGELTLQKSKVDLHEILQAVIQSMQLQIENKNGKIIVELNANKHLMNADEFHISRAFCNLIDNALKYSNENCIIKINSFNQKNDISISIIDNGIGIEKSFHKKVFENYFRVPTGNLHNVKGFGLGLAYAKKIIEHHGGNINLKSEKNLGTTFIITLPNA